MLQKDLTSLPDRCTVAPFLGKRDLRLLTGEGASQFGQDDRSAMHAPRASTAFTGLRPANQETVSHWRSVPSADTGIGFFVAPNHDSVKRSGP